MMNPFNRLFFHGALLNFNSALTVQQLGHGLRADKTNHFFRYSFSQIEIRV